MKIDKLKEKIQAANARINELRAEIQKELRSELTDALSELFDVYPCVQSVNFVAYTPYFNDGDECIYDVHHQWCGFNGVDADGEGELIGEDVITNADETIWNYSGSASKQIPNPNYNKFHAEAVKAFRNALNAVDDDNWKEMVGDHVKVTITREGIETEEYEHD